MPSRMAKRVLRLEQTQDTWHATVRQAPTWIFPRGEKPHRPFMLLVLDPERGLVRLTRFFDARPSTAEVMGQLMRAMTRPAPDSGPRYRPASICFDDAELVQALGPHTEELGVACVYRASLPLVDEAARSLADYLHEEKETLEGLLRLPGYTRPLVEEFFAAAAAFYRQAPWKEVPNDLPIELRYPADAQARCAIVMGSHQEAYGLSLYESYADLTQVLAAKEPQTAHQGIISVALTFVPAPAMPFEDLDAIDKFGWEVAGDEGYPIAVKLTGDGRFVRPSVSEFVYLTAAVRAVPQFISDYLCPDEKDEFFEPARAILPLPPVHGGQQIALAFPPAEGTEDSESSETDKAPFDALDTFIADWYWDETSCQLAQRIGFFFLLFFHYLLDSGLTPRTIRTHQRNCWVIGLALCDALGEDEFDPDIFLGGPKFVGTFRREISASKTALKSYRATWNKLRRFAIEMPTYFESLLENEAPEED